MLSLARGIAHWADFSLKPLSRFRCSTSGSAHAGKKSCYPQLREKGLLKSAAEKSLFIVAIQAIDKRAERERLFP